MFEARLIQGNLLKKLVEALKELVQEGANEPLPVTAAVLGLKTPAKLCPASPVCSEL